VHNARNRWAALRADAGLGTSGRDGAGTSQAAKSAGPGDGLAQSADKTEHATAGEGPAPFSSAKRRADELLAHARRQHAAALAGLRAELDLYEKAGAKLAALADPAALDLEIATIAARAGRQVAQAEQEAADARHATLAAQRERDEAVRLREAADDAAEQLEQDTAAAERILAERTEGFERDLADLVSRTRAAEEAQRAAQKDAAVAKAEADKQIAAARAQANAQVAAARDQARREAAEAHSRADALAAVARQEAARTVAEAKEQAARERELLTERASAAQAGADRARADAAHARRSADDARQEARAAQGERDAAQAAATAATATAATASARVYAVAAELTYARNELSRLRETHASELARLAAANDALLKAERTRADGAETHLATLHGLIPGSVPPTQ
jgi:colicin import membrane protein